MKCIIMVFALWTLKVNQKKKKWKWASSIIFAINLHQWARPRLKPLRIWMKKKKPSHKWHADARCHCTRSQIIRLHGLCDICCAFSNCVFESIIDTRERMPNIVDEKILMFYRRRRRREKQKKKLNSKFWFDLLLSQLLFTKEKKKTIAIHLTSS